MHWTHEELTEATGLELPERPRALPWYARVLMGVGGWIAAHFVLGFLALCLATTPEAWALCGVATLGIAVVVQRAAYGVSAGLDALEQGAFAFGLAGRALLVAGLLEWLDPIPLAVVMTAVEGGLLFAFPNTLQRLASTMAIPTLWLVSLEGWDHMWVVEGLGVLTAALGLMLLAVRHPLEQRAAQLEAPRMWGHRAADVRVVTGLTSDVGMGLALWTMGLEAFRFVGPGGVLPFGLLYGALGGLVVVRLVSSQELTVRQQLAAGLGVVALLGLGSQVPGLPLAVAFTLVAVRTRHTLLAGLAVGFVVAYIGLFYYQLTATLAVKGGALLLGGLVLLSLRGVAGVASPSRGERTGRGWRTATAAALVGTLGLVGARIASSEAQLQGAETVYLELAPRDPRSLVQGDYMVLRYTMDREARRLSDDDIVAELDDDRVIRRLRPRYGPLDPNQRLLRRSMWRGDAPLATDSFLFQEGHAEVYAQARYGVFALSPSGRMTLVDLVDEDLRPLAPPPPRW